MEHGGMEYMAENYNTYNRNVNLLKAVAMCQK